MKILYVGDPHYSSVNLSSRKDFYPDTMLEKTKQVMELTDKLKVDILIFGGDFCHTKRLSKKYENKLLTLFRQYPVLKASVIGNHDCNFGKSETVNETSLGTFFLSDVFLPTPGTWVIENEKVIIVFFPYMEKIKEGKLELPKDKIKILCTHYYLNNKWGSKDILPEKFTNMFDYILLGHDHDIYPVTQVNRAKIIRPGSLGRGTKIKSNWKRDVMVAFIDTEKKIAEYIKLNVKPASEIFSKERLKLEHAIKESRLKNQFLKIPDLNKFKDPSLILDKMPLESNLKDRVKIWFTEFGIVN